MSVGFRKAEPPPPPREDVVWRLVLRDKHAHAAVRMYPHGAELRVYVGGSLIASYLHRDDAIAALQAQSAEHLAAFLGKGWTRVPND